MNKKISIVVPIKGQYEYLKGMIAQAVTVKSHEFELLIQDNNQDNQEILDYLDQVDQSNITYVHDASPKNMVENFESGIENAQGEYITLLGSDDGFSSHIVTLAKLLSDQKIESCVTNKAIYYWPGMKFKAHHDRPSLTFTHGQGKTSFLNVIDELNKNLKEGMVVIGKLPSPYHGIIKKSALDQVKAISGRYIPAATPDMAMAVALSCVVTSHVNVDLPFIISGQSYHSAGGKGARGEHKGDLKGKSFLPNDIELYWPDRIPKVWTGPTLYADSTYNALRNMNQLHLFKRFNYEANYAYITSFFPEYSSMVQNQVQNRLMSLIKLSYYTLRLFLKRSGLFVLNALMSRFKVSHKHIEFHVQTSFHAQHSVDEYVERWIQKLSIQYQKEKSHV